MLDKLCDGQAGGPRDRFNDARAGDRRDQEPKVPLGRVFPLRNRLPNTSSSGTAYTEVWFHQTKKSAPPTDVRWLNRDIHCTVPPQPAPLVGQGPLTVRDQEFNRHDD